MNDIKIYKCPNNHHWLNSTFCPFCGNEPTKTIKYNPGDCIKCGCLCPEYAYGCNTPEPIQ